MALIAAYRLYLDQIGAIGLEPVLSITRAWTLLRFFKADMLQMSTCSDCGGKFVNHAHAPDRNFVCGLCRAPSRAKLGSDASHKTISRRQKPLKQEAVTHFT